MGILRWIGSRIWDGIESVGYRIKGALTALFGKPPLTSEKQQKIRAARREKWINIGYDQRVIGPVEVDGELYYEEDYGTPK